MLERCCPCSILRRGVPALLCTLHPYHTSPPSSFSGALSSSLLLRGASVSCTRSFASRPQNSFKQQPRRPEQDLSQVLDALIAQRQPLAGPTYAELLRAVAKASALDREAAFSNPQRRGQVQQLITGVEGRTFASFAPRFQANSLHSLAKMHQQGQPRLDVPIPAWVQRTLVPVLLRRSALHKYNAQDLANTVWALATLRVPDKAVFEALACTWPRA